MVLPAGVQIVVDPPDAGLAESPHFFLVHQPEGTTDVDADLVSDVAHGRRNILNLLVGWPPAAVDDTVPDGAGGLGLLGAFDQFFL
jgi:hypothetical protein